MILKNPPNIIERIFLLSRAPANYSSPLWPPQRAGSRHAQYNNAGGGEETCPQCLRISACRRGLGEGHSTQLNIFTAPQPSAALVWVGNSHVQIVEKFPQFLEKFYKA